MPIRSKVEINQKVLRGEILAFYKNFKSVCFFSPASGSVKNIIFNEKHRLKQIIIESDEKFEDFQHDRLESKEFSKENILNYLCKNGLFSHIKMRPYDVFAVDDKLPGAIFIKALEKAPFMPSYEMQIKGLEEFFDTGLLALSHVSKDLHIVHDKNSECKNFIHPSVGKSHSAEGAYPVSNSSVHINIIRPIRSEDDIIWTLDVLDVIAIGKMLLTGKYYTKRIFSIAGANILEDQRSFYEIDFGFPIKPIVENMTFEKDGCNILGNILTGTKVYEDNFIFYKSLGFCSIFHKKEKNLFANFRIFKKLKQFTDNLNGEERAFVDGSVYDRVMPLDILTMPLIKAILAKDYNLAKKLGILEVAAEDFALSTFVCPSKIELLKIVENALIFLGSEKFG